MMYLVSEGTLINGRWFWSNQKMNLQELEQFVINMELNQKVTIKAVAGDDKDAEN